MKGGQRYIMLYLSERTGLFAVDRNLVQLIRETGIQYQEPAFGGYYVSDWFEVKAVVRRMLDAGLLQVVDKVAVGKRRNSPRQVKAKRLAPVDKAITAKQLVDALLVVDSL